MPIYEYQCSQCRQVMEVRQKFSDPPLARCAECGGPVSKLISLTSFQLKGTGWYASDYKKSPAAPKPADTPSTAPAEKACAGPCAAPGKTKTESAAN